MIFVGWILPKKNGHKPQLEKSPLFLFAQFAISEVNGIYQLSIELTAFDVRCIGVRFPRLVIIEEENIIGSVLNFRYGFSVEPTHMAVETRDIQTLPFLVIVGQSPNVDFSAI